MRTVSNREDRRILGRLERCPYRHEAVLQVKPGFLEPGKGPCPGGTDRQFGGQFPAVIEDNRIRQNLADPVVLDQLDALP